MSGSGNSTTLCRKLGAELFLERVSECCVVVGSRSARFYGGSRFGFNVNGCRVSASPRIELL